MNLSNNDIKRINDFYNKLIADNGYSSQALSRNNEYTQKIRFITLSQISNLANKTILDVGCWFGDLYDFLTKEGCNNFKYTGLDILPTMIEKAKERHPDIEFIEAEYHKYKADRYDIILSSGALSFKIPNYKDYYFGMIEKMYKESKIAIGFNMLNAKGHVDDNTFTAYSLPEVYEFCSTLTENIIIRQDYLPHDFTFYLYH